MVSFSRTEDLLIHLPPYKHGQIDAQKGKGEKKKRKKK
jgi:hypothetical protein